MPDIRITDSTDRNRFINILAQYCGDPFTIGNFISNALASSPRAGGLANNIVKYGAPKSVAQGILGKLENYGSDVDGRHVLALVIDQLKAQDETGLEDSAFLSGLIYKYKLIYPANPARLTEAGVPESYVNKTLSFLDGQKWVKRIQEITGQVCQIDASPSCGSGFLIGPDLVLTNYHVLKKVIEQGVAASEVVLTFDYTHVGGGVPMKLASDWLVDYSEYDPEEFSTLEPKECPLEKLDYALVRLSTRAGDARGWVTQAQINEAHDFMRKPALFIVQHPGCQPLKIALDTNAVISVRKNGSRVRYRTNTQPGSSGSPCFDENWNLVALHHSGDPNRNDAMWNEGIPIKAVMALLKQRGKLNDVG